jgi:hypothetical protein
MFTIKEKKVKSYGRLLMKKILLKTRTKKTLLSTKRNTNEIVHKKHIERRS